MFAHIAKNKKFCRSTIQFHSNKDNINDVRNAGFASTVHSFQSKAVFFANPVNADISVGSDGDGSDVVRRLNSISSWVDE